MDKDHKASENDKVSKTQTKEEKRTFLRQALINGEKSGWVINFNRHDFMAKLRKLK